MASVADCEHAFQTLADRLARADQSTRKKAALDRTLSCRLRDLDVVFTGRIHDGLLSDVTRSDDATAQVRMTMSSDDLVKLVDGTLHMAAAWASGRVKIDASMFDLLRLRSIF